ncbi:hypothetical protein HDV57DRAFT_504185 [Trichoderma longibrachiatum]
MRLFSFPGGKSLALRHVKRSPLSASERATSPAKEIFFAGCSQSVSQNGMDLVRPAIDRLSLKRKPLATHRVRPTSWSEKSSGTVETGGASDWAIGGAGIGETVYSLTKRRSSRSRYGVSFGGVETERGGTKGKGKPRPGNQGSRLGSIWCCIKSDASAWKLAERSWRGASAGPQQGGGEGGDD